MSVRKRACPKHASNAQGAHPTANAECGPERAFRAMARSGNRPPGKSLTQRFHDFPIPTKANEFDGRESPAPRQAQCHQNADAGDEEIWPCIERPLPGPDPLGMSRKRPEIRDEPKAASAPGFASRLYRRREAFTRNQAWGTVCSFSRISDIEFGLPGNPSGVNGIHGTSVPKEDRASTVYLRVSRLLH